MSVVLPSKPFVLVMICVAVAVFSLLVFTVPCTAQSPTPLDAVTIVPTDKNLVYFGRWDRTDPTVSHSHWQSGYIRVRFTGTSVAVKMQSGNYLVTSIDGEPPRFVSGISGITPLNLYPLKPGLHSLLVGAPAGGEMLFQGLVLDPGAIVEPPFPRPIIEFIGDSITWGTGPGNLWGVNWAWDSAEALNCDHTQVAQSGRALTTGYGCAPPLVGLDQQYFKLKNFGYTDAPLWDMTTYTPSAVVINLGQNDQCGNEPDATFIPSYENFIKKIQADFPKAQIVLIRMFGGGHFGDDTRQIAAAMNGEGDANVHFIDTDGWLGKGDFRDGVHPNDQGNAKIAARLAPALRPFVAAAVVPPAIATIGNPGNPDALDEELQNAYLRGERKLVVTPGVYVFPSEGQAHLPINYWQDATISAYKTTFLLKDPQSSDILFNLRGCVDTTIAGCLASQTTQPAYQGRVTNVGANDQGKAFVDWTPSVGYPVPPAGLTTLWINIVDGKTGKLKYGVGDYYNAQLAPLSNGVFRIQLNDASLNFGLGDIVVARYGDPPRKANLDGCTDCTLEDFTMMRNGFAPIFDGGGSSDHFLRDHWMLGPRPNGATENPVVTNAADGIHAPGDYPGPDIEYCTFDGVFLDDCIAIHGNYQAVKSVDGSSMVVSNGYANLRVGEPTRISNSQGFYLQANVTALKDNGDGTTTVTIDSSTPVPVGAKMSNPLRDGQGYKIIGCRLGDTRSRGIICKADNGVIQGNVIAHCGEAISIGPEYGENESDYCNNVVIQGNMITDNGFNGDNSIYIHGEGVEQNKNITISNNKFVGNFGSDIHLDSVDGITVAGNIFTAPADWMSWNKPHDVMGVTNDNAVAISGNTVTTPKAFVAPYVTQYGNSTNLTQDFPAKP